MQPVVVTAEVISKQFEVNALASDSTIEVAVGIIGRTGPTGPQGPQGPPGQDGSIGIETDPVFVASAAFGISAGDITNWNSKEVGGAAAAALSVAESYTDTQVAAAIVTANSYTDSEIAALSSVYDPLGAAAAAIVTAGAYTDSSIAALSSVYVPLTRTVNGHPLSSNVTVTASDVGLGNVDDTSDVNKPVSTSQAAAIALKVTANAAITGATKTKITYDSKGLVTAGADATTADIADSLNKRYVTDVQLVVIGNTSGINTGDQNLSGLQPLDATLTALAGLTITANSLIYGTGADAFSVLAQNATATRKFLREVSSGAPAWDTLVAGDIPDISATYLTIDGNNAGATVSAQQFDFGIRTNIINEIPGNGVTVNVSGIGFIVVGTSVSLNLDDIAKAVTLSSQTGVGWSIDQNGVWYPLTDGSNIGIASTNRIGTIYMSSNIDYVTNMNFTIGGVPKIVFDNTGAITTGIWNGTAIADTYIASAATWNAKQNALGFTAVPDTRTVNGQALSGDVTVTTISGNAGTATALQNARTIGGVSFNGTANITVASATGGFTVSGGDLAIGANNLTITGSIGATGARVLKGWFTDLQVTNTIAGSITGSAATLTTPRAINGVNFDGSAAITVTAAAGTLTGTTLNSTVVTSSLTSVGTLANLTVTNPISGSVTGSAATLTNARTIGGVSFNGSANITVSTATAGFTVTGGTLTAPAGTTSISAVTLPSGSLTTAGNIAAGQMSFDGVNLYGVLDTTSGWGEIPIEQHFHLASDGGNITTIANFFGATSNISLVASAYYDIEILLVFLKTTTEILTITLTNSSAPTSQNIRWEQSPITGMVAPPGTATALVGFVQNDATATKAIAAGSLTTAQNHYIKINIWMKNGTGTSLKILATNPAGSITPRLGSYWKCRRIPAGNTGTFAA